MKWKEITQVLAVKAAVKNGARTVVGKRNSEVPFNQAEVCQMDGRISEQGALGRGRRLRLLKGM